MPEIPIPDFAVPYAAPIPILHQHTSFGVAMDMPTSKGHGSAYAGLGELLANGLPARRGELKPTIPKNGANLGV